MGHRGKHQGTHGQLQPRNPPGHGPATLAGCLSAPKHHPERTEEPPGVPSSPGAPLGRAHLEAAGVPVVPGTFGLFLLLCRGKTEDKSLQGIRRKQLPSRQCPQHSSATSTGLWSAPCTTHSAQPARSWGQPFHRVPKATLGLGTPTLVLQGLQALLGLAVQLFQVRGPRAGEEDVVGTFLARRVLHAQPLLALALGSACGDSGVSWAGGDTATLPPRGDEPRVVTATPGVTLSRSAPSQALETPREIPSCRLCPAGRYSGVRMSPLGFSMGCGRNPPPSPAPSLGANEAVNCVGLGAAEQGRGSTGGD